MFVYLHIKELVMEKLRALFKWLIKELRETSQNAPKETRW